MYAGSVTKGSLVIYSAFGAYEFPRKNKKKGHMIEGRVLHNNTIIEGDVISAIGSQDCPPDWQLEPFINEAYSYQSRIIPIIY
jgi:hypothetical protein